MKKLLTIILVAITVQSFAPIKIFKDEEIIKTELTHKEKVILSIIEVESGGDSIAYNELEDAVGILQLRKIYVKQANRISNKKYTYNDRWSKDKSIEIFETIMDSMCPSYDLDSTACIHNAGNISRYDWHITTVYRNKVKEIYKTL